MSGMKLTWDREANSGYGFDIHYNRESGLFIMVWTKTKSIQLYSDRHFEV